MPQPLPQPSPPSMPSHAAVVANAHTFSRAAPPALLAQPWNSEEHHALADVGPVVQEIVDRADYAQGNALTIFLAGTGNAIF